MMLLRLFDSFMCFRNEIRTHDCGSLRIGDVGKIVKISGWVHSSRDLNHFCFIDVRDRYDITQVVVPVEKREMYDLACSLGKILLFFF